MIVTTDKVVEILTERREFERHPVSLLANVKAQGVNEPFKVAYVKNLSYSGAYIYTEREMQVEEQLSVDLFMNNNVVRQEAQVVRASVRFGRYEVGVQFRHRDFEDMQTTRDVIDKYVTQEKYLLQKQLETVRVK